MMLDLDIWRVARLIIDQRGARASSWRAIVTTLL